MIKDMATLSVVVEKSMKEFAQSVEAIQRLSQKVQRHDQLFTELRDEMELLTREVNQLKTVLQSVVNNVQNPSEYRQAKL